MRYSLGGAAAFGFCSWGDSLAGIYVTPKRLGLFVRGAIMVRLASVRLASQVIIIV